MTRLQELYADPAPATTGSAEGAILRSGIRLFGERGYGATTVRQIAADAGVTPPLIAYHFTSKEGLFRACVDVVTEGITRVIVDTVDTAPGIEEMVRALTRAHLEFPQHHPAAVRLMLSVAYGPEDMQPMVDLLTPWASAMEKIEERIQAAIDDGEFVPRPGATPLALTRHLFHLLHMAVFAEVEKERRRERLGTSRRFATPSDDPVSDIRDQFFLGAGQLAAPGPETVEEA